MSNEPSAAAPAADAAQAPPPTTTTTTTTAEPAGATSAPAVVTTELIQKYLDENQQLILAILENQNVGKLVECAKYQTKLQENLMYLAAIADAQPVKGSE
mmetsp:Transcript_4912/g.17836  ORF Transcript_4912/g.17836 Transcript_4912/m.17836 type:complete len:100 (+) Transcript_4912:581-880(+)